MGRHGGHLPAPRLLALGLVLAALALLVLLVPDARGAAGTTDFGDAPDGAPARYLTAPSVSGHFPAKLASHGPRHTSLGKLFLGAGVSGEANSRQVDADTLDDGTSASLTACKKSTVKVLINGAGLSSAQLTKANTIYVNVWADWNRDGDWADGPDGCAREWVVENLPVTGDKLGGAKKLLLPVSFRAGKQAKELWYRVTLTLNQPAVDPTGRGGSTPFTAGETEDRLIQRFGTAQPVWTPRRKKPPPPPEKPKFKVACVPNPVIIPHGGKARINLKILKGTGEIRGSFDGPSSGPGYKVTPHPVSPQPKGFPKNGRFVVDYLQVKHTKVDPPTRIQVIVIKLRFSQGKQVQRLNCVVIVVHVAKQFVPFVFPQPFLCGGVCGGAPRAVPPAGNALTTRWHRKDVIPPGGSVPVELVSLELKSVAPLPGPIDGFRIRLDQFAAPWGARLIQSNEPGTKCDVAARDGGKPSLDCHFPQKPQGASSIDSFFDIFFELPPPQSQTFEVDTARYQYDSKGRIVKATDVNSFPASFQPPPQCSDGSDNDADGKIDLADPGCQTAQDNDETDPPFVGNGTGTFTAAGATIQWQIGFDHATSGFKIVVPGNRAISNASVQGTGFSCSVTTTTTANDSYSCTKNLAANTPAQGQFDINPGPSSGMGGSLYGYQGTSQGGPFTITGPS